MATTWRRNEPVAARRRCVLNVTSALDGITPAPVTTDLTGKVFIRLGAQSFTTASGTLTSIRYPLIVADDVVEGVDTTDNEIDIASHPYRTGDGPFTFSSTGSLPGGLSAATNYWIIWRSDGAFSLAATLGDALAGNEVDFSSAGSGTITISDTASTERLIPGRLLYEATQMEADAETDEIEIAVIDEAWYAQTLVRIEHGDAAELAVVEGSDTLFDIIREMRALICNKMTGVDAVRAANGSGDVTFFAADGVTPRVVVTYSSDGRPNKAVLDLT